MWEVRLSNERDRVFSVWTMSEEIGRDEKEGIKGAACL